MYNRIASPLHFRESFHFLELLVQFVLILAVGSFLESRFDVRSVERHEPRLWRHGETRFEGVVKLGFVRRNTSNVTLFAEANACVICGVLVDE